MYTSMRVKKRRSRPQVAPPGPCGASNRRRGADAPNLRWINHADRRAQKNAIGDSKHRRVDSQTQGKRRNDAGRERRTSFETSKDEAHVLLHRQNPFTQVQAPLAIFG